MLDFELAKMSDAEVGDPDLRTTLTVMPERCVRGGHEARCGESLSRHCQLGAVGASMLPESQSTPSSTGAGLLAPNEK